MNYTTPRDKTCPDCGRTFAAYSPKQKRCPECQTRIRRERHLAQMRAWAKRHSTATHEERKCKLCWKPFISAHRRHYFCSAECQIEAKQGAKHIERTCKRCGKKFITSRLNQLYCTHDCMVRFHREGEKKRLEKWRAAHGAPPRANKPKGPKGPKKTASVQQQDRSAMGKAEPWQVKVARELAIPDPDARFAAAQKWTPKERKYAQKLAMRGMGWRGPAYGI